MCLAADADSEPRLRYIRQIISAVTNDQPIAVMKLRIESESGERKFCPIYVGWRRIVRHNLVVNNDVQFAFPITRQLTNTVALAIERNQEHVSNGEFCHVRLLADRRNVRNHIMRDR